MGPPQALSIKEGEDYSLYVKDIPLELDEDGIKKLFQNYGTISSIISPRNATYAFVNYPTYAEAEAAIRALDKQPPLYLTVEFRKRKLPETPTTPNSTATNGTIKDFRYADATYARFSRPNSSVLQIKLPPSGLSATRYSADPQGYSPDDSASNLYDDLTYPETNALWTRGITTLDAAGRRHVTLGRAYTHYHIPEPSSGVADQIARVYERRNPGSYTFGTDELETYVGKCTKCANDAILTCARCKSFYCSRDCQLADWPKHQSECIIVPDLIRASPPIASRPVTGEKLVKTDLSPKVDTESIPPKPAQTAPVVTELRRPAQTPAPSTSEEVPAMPKETTSAATRFKVPEQETAKKPTSSLAARLQNCRKAAIDDSDFIFKKRTFLSPTDFIDVQIVFAVQPGLYCVQKVSDVPKLHDLMQKLQVEADKFVRPEQLIIGKVYATLYDGIWHRASITSLNPTTVDYVDFGNVEEVDREDFWELGELSESPRFAATIRVPADASDHYKTLKEDEVISVKMVNVERNGIINVEIKDDKPKTNPVQSQAEKPTVKKAPAVDSPLRPLKSETLANAALKNVQQSAVQKPDVETQRVLVKKVEYILPNVLDVMVPGMKGVVADIVELIDERSACVFLVHNDVSDAFNMLLDPLKDDCDALLSKAKNYCPKINDLVCCRKPDDDYWLRGRILEVQPTLKIASLDEGIVITNAAKVIPLPIRFKEVHTFTVIMETDTKFPILVGSSGNLEIIKREVINGECIVHAKLSEADFSNIQIRLRPWGITASVDNAVQAKRPLPSSVQIKNKSQVVIQSHRATSIVFLRPLDDAEVEKYNRLCQDVAKAALTAENFVSMPQLRDLVLAKYLDENYYRAIVLAIDGEIIKIGYVDFGNNETTDLSKLKKMPEALMTRPTSSAKAKLKGIPDVPATKAAVDYLGLLAAKEEPFICTFDGSLDNGVTLKTAKNESVNDFLIELLTPNYKDDNNADNEIADDDDDNKPIVLSDIDMAILGTVGQTLKVIYLDVVDPGLKYVFAPIDTDMIVHISEVLPAVLQTYSETVQHYIPRPNEMCIAKFEDGWYRGCCIKPSFAPSAAEIYFVDFGNIAIIDHKDIRRMQKEFLHPPALGCICAVNGLIPTDVEPSEQLLKRLESLLVPNQYYEVKILKKVEAEWTIEVPEIRKVLVDEGLI